MKCWLGILELFAFCTWKIKRALIFKCQKSNCLNIFLWWKSVYVKLANWTQFRWFQFCWQHPEHHNEGPSEHMLASFLPSGLKRVLTLATPVSQNFFTSCLIWCLLASASTMNTSVLFSFIFFMVDSVVRGNLMMRQWSSLFLLCMLFGGDLGCLWSSRVLGPWRMGDMWIGSSFCGCRCLSALPCLASKAFALAWWKEHCWFFLSCHVLNCFLKVYVYSHRCELLSALFGEALFPAQDQQSMQSTGIYNVLRLSNSDPHP